MGGPSTLYERCGGGSVGDIVRISTNEISERASNVALLQLVALVGHSKLDRGARRAGHGRTRGLEVDRLRDPEIVVLPQSERERAHVKRIDEPAGATQDVIAEVITSWGGQRGIRGISASVVLVTSEINDDDRGGVGDGEDAEGTVWQERTRQTESTALVALDEGAQISVVLVQAGHLDKEDVQLPVIAGVEEILIDDTSGGEHTG